MTDMLDGLVWKPWPKDQRYSVAEIPNRVRIVFGKHGYFARELDSEGQMSGGMYHTSDRLEIVKAVERILERRDLSIRLPQSEI
jgi:hypothetical protein